MDLTTRFGERNRVKVSVLTFIVFATIVLAAGIPAGLPSTEVTLQMTLAAIAGLALLYTLSP